MLSRDTLIQLTQISKKAGNDSKMHAVVIWFREYKWLEIWFYNVRLEE